MSTKPQPEKFDDDPLLQLRRLADPAEQDDVSSDADLLALYVNGGDRGALETLIKRYAPMVASVCRLTVSDPASAEDAFQATFLILLKSAKKIRRGSSVAAWLHGVAYRSACRIRTTTRKRLSNQSNEDVITYSEPEEDPIAELARRMELEALDRELERLPQRLRQPLIEHYLLGYSAPEIASRMDLSVSAVEGRLRRGRRNLRTQLARRGISLSVVLAGASWFAQHVQATEASTWTSTFLASFPAGETQLSISSESQISSLIQGEMTMVSTGTIKAVVAAAVTLLAGTLVAITVTADDRWAVSQRGVNQELQINATDLPELVPTVVAQFQQGEAGGGGMGGGGMGGGGMGGGGMGGGGMGGGGFTQGTPAADVDPVEWERPSSDDGEMTPSWLAGGAASMTAMERNRGVLAKEIQFDLVDLKIGEIADWLHEETGTQFDVNYSTLDEWSIDLEEPITVRGNGSVRELIRRAFAPLELTYVVTESTIEITTADDAAERLSMRFYDLSYVLPNSANSLALMSAIEQTIEPDAWMNNGGTSSISIVGSMMIVSATDTTHQSIEVLLLNISKMNPRNAAHVVMPGNGPVVGGGGFGGGGMF